MSAEMALAMLLAGYAWYISSSLFDNSWPIWRPRKLVAIISIIEMRNASITIIIDASIQLRAAVAPAPARNNQRHVARKP